MIECYMVYLEIGKRSGEQVNIFLPHFGLQIICELNSKTLGKSACWRIHLCVSSPATPQSPTPLPQASQ